MRAHLSVPLGVAILLVAALTQKWYLALFSAPLLLPALLGLTLLDGRADGVRVERCISARRVTVGRELRVAITCENSSGRTVVVELEDRVPTGLTVTDGATRWLVVLKPGERRLFAYRLRASRRGRFALGPLALRVWDPLLTRSEELSLSSEEVTVLPQVRRLLWLPVRRSVTLPGFGEYPSQRGGEGVEFVEVSEAPAGHARRVNWKATAKHGKLMVNLFSEERSATVLLVLEVPSRRLLGDRTDALVDALVEAAASIAAYLHRRGHRVSLLVVGGYRDWVKPSFGKSHLLRILSSLASAHVLPYKQVVDYEEVAARVAPFLTPLGSLVIIVSSFVDADGWAVSRALRRRGFSVLHVAVNPFSTAGLGRSSERLAQVWLRGLVRRARGVSLWVWMSPRASSGFAVVRQVA